MIIKSLSRKTPSFGQLAEYMSSEKADARYDIHHHVYAQNPVDIATEFSFNSQNLSHRKNGNYLYHEIISVVTTEATCSHTEIKETLHDIAQRYIQQRSPNNMVYGCLHEDHAHNLHYHLMISANERGEHKRLRLTKAKFDRVKKDLEQHVLSHYPELKQTALMNKAEQGEKLSVKAGELKRRSGKMPKRDEVKETLQAAMSQTNTLENFYFFLEERGYQFYTRGKHYGVEVLHEDGKIKKYRFATLGLHEDFEAFTDKLSEQLGQAEQSKVNEQVDSKQETVAEQSLDPEIDSKETGDDMKLRDVFGIHETQKDKKKEQKAKQSSKEQIENSTKQTQSQMKAEMQASEQRTAKKTAKEVQAEFERVTEKQKTAQKYSDKDQQKQ